MITAVAITPDAITNPSGRYIDGAHGHLCDLLRSHSVFVFTEEEDRRFCVVAAQGLPGGVGRTKWLELLRRLETLVIHRPPRPLTELSHLASVKEWRDRAALLLVAPDQFGGIVGPDANQRVVIDGATGIELAHAELIHLTKSIGDLSRKAKITIRSGEFPGAPIDREELWAGWMLPLARSHLNITIVDAYVGKNVAEQASRLGFRDGNKPMGDLAELPWLLSRIAENAPVEEDGSPRVTVTVLTAKTGSYDRLKLKSGELLTRELIEEAFSEMVSFLAADGVPVFGPGRRIRSLVLRTYSNDVREHPRHIRFTNSTPSREAFHRFLRFEAGLDALRYRDLSKQRKGQMSGSWDLTYRVGPNPSTSHGNAREEARLLERSTKSEIHLSYDALLMHNER